MMKNAIKVALLGVAVLSAACSDAVAPRSDASNTRDVAVGGVTTNLTSYGKITFGIDIDPWRTTSFYLGAGNTLIFPAGSVCDMSQTSYGEGQWDKPCVAARSTVHETVTAWLDSHGHPQVDFSPNLRFVPSELPTGWVTLSFSDYQASLDPLFNILYCHTPTSQCVDESKKDASLLTVRNPVTGKVTRRIKHFSGYLVGAGDDSTSDGRDGNRVGGQVSFPQAVGSPSEHRSGYILVSGRQ
jgi:hypothetical protein